MRRIRCGKWFFASFLIPLTGLIFIPVACAQRGEVAVIVNPNNPVVNISLADLRKIFTGEKHSWPGGIPVKPIVRAPGSHERLVLLRLLRMSESEFKQFWTAQIFRGEAEAEPLVVPSFGMAIEAARIYPGAIAFVDVQDVKPGRFMKVIRVDRRLPGDEGYPLH